ncbi:Domain of unknown function DUF1708 [Phaffia rhodozyma]|uniref:Meiotically up-regulated protein Msb1/Mug8 domain-containing protein n=1 Tax=Phaffia rhodozyma TaxID=264483 RepID=A0A0F7SQA0_PHARH|nr:Domain of unknown function DUF1708 [Phaffia rhodozyma]
MLTQPPSSSPFASSTPTGTFSNALKLFSRRRSLSARTPLEESKARPRSSLSNAPQLELNFTDLINGHPRDGHTEESPVEEEEDPGEKQKREERILENIWFREEEVREFFDIVGKAMKGKGIATPGLFLPHRPSQSPSIQHALLIYFAQTHRPSLFSLRSSSLSLSQPSPQYLFLTELKYALNVHDLASVIRFSLRHLDSSKGMSRRALYDTFAVSEREAGFPSQSWSTFVPEGEDKELIRSVLEVLMSAASVVDTSGVSIGKLSMIIGFWVFRSRGWAVGEREARGVEELFKEWEIWGRRLEHLLLAYIRDQASRMQIQTRLLPLIQSYPNSSRLAQSHLTQTSSPKPASHRQPDAAPSVSGLFLTSHRLKRVLHLRIRAAPCRTVPLLEKEVRTSPVQLINWAVEARVEGSSWSNAKAGPQRREEEEAMGIWIEMRRQAREEKEMSLEGIFTGETIRILGITSDKVQISKDSSDTLSTKETGQKKVECETHELYRPFGASRSSFALQDSVKSHQKNASPLVTLDHLKSTPSIKRPELKAETWTDFSLAGFGDSPGVPLKGEMHQGLFQDASTNLPWEETLGEEEEGSKRISARSLDMERIMRDESVETARTNLLKLDDEGWNGAMEVAGASMLNMDEAFVEFSQDIQLDPGSVSQTTFPTFALYELKASSFSPEWLMVSISSLLPSIGTRAPIRSDQAALTPMTSAIMNLSAPKSRRQASFLESLTPNFFGHKLSARSSSEEKPSLLPADLPGRRSGIPSPELSVTAIEVSSVQPPPSKPSRKSVSDDYVITDGLIDRRSKNISSASPSPLLERDQPVLKEHDSVLVDQKITSTGPLRRLRSFLGGKNTLNAIDDNEEEDVTPTRTTFAAVSSSAQASFPSSWTDDTQEGRIVDIGRTSSPHPVGLNSRTGLVILGPTISDLPVDAEEDTGNEPSVDIGNDSDLAIIAEILSLGKDQSVNTQERDREGSVQWEGVLPKVEISPPCAPSEDSAVDPKQEMSNSEEINTPSFVSFVTPAEDEDGEGLATEKLPSEDSQGSIHSSVSERSTQRSELGSVATTVESCAVKSPLQAVHGNIPQIEDLGREIFVDDTVTEEIEGTLGEDTSEVEYKPTLKQLTLLARPHSPPPPLPARSASRERLVRPVKMIAPEMVPLPSSP